MRRILCLVLAVGTVLSLLAPTMAMQVASVDGSVVVNISTVTGDVTAVQAGGKRVFEVQASAVLDAKQSSVAVRRVATGVEVVRDYEPPSPSLAPVSIVAVFSPAPTSVHWEITVLGRGGTSPTGNWTAPISTQVAWTDPNATAALQTWAPWDRGSAWHSPPTIDPLLPSDGHPGFLTGHYRYGSVVGQPKGADMIVAPQFTVLEAASDSAVSLLLSPEDRFLELDLYTYSGPTPRFSFNRSLFRLSSAAKYVFSADIIAHEACFRPALAWSIARYPTYWRASSEQAAKRVDGLASYSWYLGDVSAPDYHAMDYAVNWDLSGRFFPYMSMFLPPVREGEQWLNDPLGTQARANVTFSSIDAYYERVGAAGFASLSYFNLFEAGQNITCWNSSATPGPAAADWKDPTAWLQATVGDALLTHHWDPSSGGEHQGCMFTWQQGTVFDPATASFAAHLATQMQRHVARLPHFTGVVVDRSDWNRFYNLAADDGVSWVTNQSARSMKEGFAAAARSMRSIIGNESRSMLLNTAGYAALSLMEPFDGTFSEGNALASVGILGAVSPAILWTYSATACCATQAMADTFMQWHLYLGVYPMVPFPGNDHSIEPGSAIANASYRAYGAMFAALRGTEWLLIARPVSVVVGTAKVNAFTSTTTTEHVYAIVLAGASQPAVAISLNGLPGQSAVASVSFDFDVLHAGADAGWTAVQPTSVNATGIGAAEVTVPLLRGAAMMRVIARQFA